MMCNSNTHFNKNLCKVFSKRKKEKNIDGVFKGANSEYLTTYYLRIYYKGGIYNVYLRKIWSV